MTHWIMEAQKAINFITGKHEQKRTKKFHIWPNIVNKYENLNRDLKERNSNQSSNANNKTTTEINKPISIIDLTVSDLWIHFKDIK